MQAAESAADPKHAQPLELWIFIYHVVSMSNNIFAMDLANILHAEDRFFCSAQKFFCDQTMFGNKTFLVVQCLMAVKQQYLNIKIVLFAQ